MTAPGRCIVRLSAVRVARDADILKDRTVRAFKAAGTDGYSIPVSDPSGRRPTCPQGARPRGAGREGLTYALGCRHTTTRRV